MIREESDLLKETLDYCFSLTVNLNDTFYYASADAEEIEPYDIAKMLPVMDKYGVRDTLVAYAAIKRQHDPQIPRSLTKEFYKAKEELLKLIDSKKIMHEHVFDINQDNKIMEQFDGEMPQHSSYVRNNFLNIGGIKKKVVMHKFKLKSGLISVSGTYSSALRRLKSKYDRNKSNFHFNKAKCLYCDWKGSYEEAKFETVCGDGCCQDYVCPKCDSGAIPEFEGKELLIVGVLLRDTTPNADDLQRRGKRLSQKLREPTKTILFAWYLPVPISDWSKVLQEEGP